MHFNELKNNSLFAWVNPSRRTMGVCKKLDVDKNAWVEYGITLYPDITSPRNPSKQIFTLGEIDAQVIPLTKRRAKIFEENQMEVYKVWGYIPNRNISTSRENENGK